MAQTRICFLTSSPSIPGTDSLNPANGFVEELRQALPESAAALFVCSDPEGHAHTDFFAAAVRESFEEAGFSFRDYRVLDSRNEDRAAQLVGEADFLILAGGHVPTQNRFFARIGLRRLLRDYQGVLLGISAGTMNSADLVYVHPELEGEAINPDFPRFLPGLGLTGTMVLPHFQYIRHETLDGLRVVEDIALPDSLGRCIYALEDGSYLLLRSGREELRGRAWRICDGELSLCCEDGERLLL